MYFCLKEGQSISERIAEIKQLKAKYELRGIDFIETNESNSAGKGDMQVFSTPAKD